MKLLVNNLVLVAIGGAIGSCLRYLIVCAITMPIFFPLPTLFVNWIGACLMGITYPILKEGRFAHALNLLITIGFLGGFTTFSSLMLECFTLINQAMIGEFILYFIVTFIGGLLAFWLGEKLGLVFITLF